MKINLLPWHYGAKPRGGYGFPEEETKPYLIIAGFQTCSEYRNGSKMFCFELVRPVAL